MSYQNLRGRGNHDSHLDIGKSDWQSRLDYARLTKDWSVLKNDTNIYNRIHYALNTGDWHSLDNESNKEVKKTALGYLKILQDYT